MSTTTEQNVRLAEVIRDVMASGAACFAGRLSEGLVDRNAPMGEALGDFPSEFLAIRPSIIDDLAAALPTPVSASGVASDTSRVDRINRTVATINAEIRNLRSLAWSNGRDGRAESLVEDTTSGLLHEAVGKLQALALGVEGGES